MIHSILSVFVFVFICFDDARIDEHNSNGINTSYFECHHNSSACGIEFRVTFYTDNGYSIGGGVLRKYIYNRSSMPRKVYLNWRDYSLENNTVSVCVFSDTGADDLVASDYDFMPVVLNPGEGALLEDGNRSGHFFNLDEWKSNAHRFLYSVTGKFKDFYNREYDVNPYEIEIHFVLGNGKNRRISRQARDGSTHEFVLSDDEPAVDVYRLVGWK